MMLVRLSSSKVYFILSSLFNTHLSVGEAIEQIKSRMNGVGQVEHHPGLFHLGWFTLSKGSAIIAWAISSSQEHKIRVESHSSFSSSTGWIVKRICRVAPSSRVTKAAAASKQAPLAERRILPDTFSAIPTPTITCMHVSKCKDNKRLHSHCRQTRLLLFSSGVLVQQLRRSGTDPSRPRRVAAPGRIGKSEPDV